MALGASRGRGCRGRRREFITSAHRLQAVSNQKRQEKKKKTPSWHSGDKTVKDKEAERS